MDQSSYKGGPNGQNLKTKREQDVPVIRRNLAQAITRGGGYWFYDFGPYRSSGWWDDPLLLSEIKKAFDVLETSYKTSYRRDADVLFVYSNETFYHIKNSNTPISSYNICDQQSADAYKAGVVFDQVFITDLQNVDLKKYKAVVFSNTFALSNAEKKFIKEKVAKDGRHIIWNYMPGYTNGDINNMQFVKDVTGIEVANAHIGGRLSIVSVNNSYPIKQKEENKDLIQPLLQITDKKVTALGVNDSTKEVMVAKKENKDHTVWYASYMFKQPESFREIFRQAGAHIYGDGNDVFHQGGGLLMVHTKAGGQKNIILKNGKTIIINMEPESTVYLNSETGETLLK
jgi:hypothetical protein